ncbi:oligosaccharide flippase family protein [Halobacillus sp. A1]|uniref:putative polysaccharide biosynthesis protein n=1 Tax=Halobacillus sp. A1 TaxID=2880262 RepID=UPI0020A682B9|nr:oligosaccharide flippase family protein [Halobacillus sp. A1]MCP3032124.1 oligosaccharide flippase family protein [Halobacillus sp. A1]
MDHTHSSHRLIKGAFLLTLSGLIGKVLSAGYRIPLQNIAGDIGFYIYQQVYPILGMAMMLALYGFPVAISKLVSELKDQGVTLTLRSFYIPAFTWLLGICGSIFLFGFTQAHHLARVMGDEALTPSLQAAFFVFLLLPVTSLIRGVFQGQGRMEPTAVSQVAEQLVRVVMIIGTALYVTRIGDIYQIGVGGALSSILGTITASVVLLVLWRRHSKFEQGTAPLPAISFSKTIFFYGLFICLNYMLLLLIQLVDSLTIVPQLVEVGYIPEEAKGTKGVFDRGQPLIQLGTVLASSLALALVPSVTRKRKDKNPDQVHQYIFGAVKYSFLIAVGAAAGLITLFPLVNELFFQNTDGTGYLRILMSVIFFSSLAITMSSVLQGLEKVVHTAFVIIGAVVMKYLLNVWWVGEFGMYGAAAASVAAVAFVVLCHVLLLHTDFSLKEWARLPWFATIGAAGSMAAVLLVIEALRAEIDGRLALLVYALVIIALGAAIYLILLIRLGALQQKELEPLPFGDWLVKLLPGGRNV